MIKTNQPITRLLKRQLKKTIGLSIDEVSNEKLLNFINLVNDAYIFNTEDREFYQRAEEIASRDYTRLNQQLIEKNNFLDTFNHGLAHDIKNHSSNIIGLVNMLKKYSVKEDWNMVNKITKKLEESSNQLTSIVQGFLHISRSEANLLDDITNVKAIDLINAIETEIEYLKKSKDVSISYKIDDVIFIQSVLKIILVNLISNSIKYSKPNLPSKIKVIVSCLHDEVFLEVKDNGIGIDLKDQSTKLYNLFNDSGATKGYGVGLFLVKKIVDKHKGNIKISSALNKGTSIKISFPKKLI